MYLRGIIMEFSQKDRELVLDWFRIKFPEHNNCDFCNLPEARYGLIPILLGAPLFFKPAEEPIKALAPFVFLCCSSCGNSKAFNATQLETLGCPGLNLLPKAPKKNIVKFLDYFKRKK